MRVVLQRVSRASVTVSNATISSISRGLCVLVGIASNDTAEDVEWMVRKVLGVRVFEDEAGVKWKTSVVNVGGEVLCVSQFTLYGSMAKGNKPDFHMSKKTSEGAKEMYELYLRRMGECYDPEKIKDGAFGEMMMVEIVNEGPITLELDSRKFVYVDKENK